MTKTDLQHGFVDYLESNYTYARPKNMASNVFYAYNNDIGISFFEIFVSDDSLLISRDLITQKFVEVGRKNPKGHASVHFGCWVKFKEYLDNTYSGVGQVMTKFYCE